MNTKTVQEKLQKAYKSMLGHIEELVEKDKKPLKEAIEEAEEKLSEWRELSREEVSHISEEIKSNLSDVGEASHRLNESLKETLSFDANYLASSVWNKLSKVADKTIVELSELSESLRKHTVNDASNYSDQQQIWLKDTELWHKNYDNSLKQLDSIRADIRKKIRQTNTFSKTVINNSNTDHQTQHDLMSQENQETTLLINKIFHQYFGEKS